MNFRDDQSTERISIQSMGLGASSVTKGMSELGCVIAFRGQRSEVSLPAEVRLSGRRREIRTSIVIAKVKE